MTQLDDTQSLRRAPTSSAPPPLPLMMPGEPELLAAVERVAPDVAEVRDDDLEKVNVDLSTALGTTLAFWHLLLPFFDLLATLPTIDRERLFKLCDYAMAMNHWHSVLQVASASPPPSPELSGDFTSGVAMRDRMLKDLSSLAAHGYVDPKTFASIGGVVAYRKVGQDLMALGTLIHSKWSEIEGKTPLTLQAADEATRLGRQILRVMIERDRMPARIAEASLQRAKTYTLFIRTYDDARQGLLFLRRRIHDVDTILPSLYTGRGPRKKRSEEPTNEEEAVVPAPAPTPAPVVKAITADEAFDP